MPKPLLTSHHPPVIAAGGIMVISLFASLVCSLAVDRLTSDILPQGGMHIPDTLTTDMPFLGLDEIDVVFTLCGDQQSHFAAVGLPVRL